MLAVVTEEQVAAWAEELAVLLGGLGHLFARPEPREVFADLMEGLLSDLRRKNGWTMAARAGHVTPSRIQKFLNAASWSAEELLASLRAYVAEHLGDPRVGGHWGASLFLSKRAFPASSPRATCGMAPSNVSPPRSAKAPAQCQNTAAFVHDLPAEHISNVEGDSTYVRVQVLTNAGALDRDK